MDSNADTACLGANFAILQYTHRSAEVYPYDPTYKPQVVPIVTGATAYDHQETGTTYIIVINEALYYGTKLDHSLLNPNQIRKYNIPLYDNPFDNGRPFGIDAPDMFIPFNTTGTKIFFNSHSPTQHELDTCVHIHLTSKVPWEPHDVQLSQVDSLPMSWDTLPNT